MDQEIDIDDCTRVSEAVSNALDESDLIKHAYFLEVASPGAERQLRNEKELLSAMGKELLISLKEPIENNDTIEGKLLRFVDNIITIQSGEQIIEVPFLDTKKIRLKIQF
jgi:ribosome maturation factor RimP